MSRDRDQRKTLDQINEVSPYKNCNRQAWEEEYDIRDFNYFKKETEEGEEEDYDDHVFTFEKNGDVTSDFDLDEEEKLSAIEFSEEPDRAGTAYLNGRISLDVTVKSMSKSPIRKIRILRKKQKLFSTTT